MKVAGHTMGTPEYSLTEAFELFKKIGLDGIEIVVQDGYGCGLPENITKKVLRETKNISASVGLPISCLTPYYSYFNSLDGEKRKKEIDGILKVLDYAEFLGTHFIRIYGGNYSQNETDSDGRKEEYLVESMQILGEEAAKRDVKLVIENHFNTMTESAAESIRISNLINHPNVGILYDQANLAFTYHENFKSAIPLQKDKIYYAHVKDLAFKTGIHEFISDEVSHPKESDRNVVTRIVGEGCIPWPEILRDLKSIGYDGWLSLEYERRWHPDDIPDAAIGMKKSCEYVKGILSLI